MGLAIFLAVSAGFAYAVASVLQQRAAYEEAPELSLRPGLLLALVRRPMWLLGSVADLGAFGLEAAALAAGSIVVVQPLLVTGLLWALPLGVIGTGLRVTRREWVPAIALVIGLAVFVSVGSPSGGRAQASATAWIAAGALVGAVVAGAIAAARKAPPNRRALLLAFASGCIYGLTAALTKSTVDLFDHGVGGVLGSWQPYVLLVVGITGLVVNQSAFQAGHLAASLPAMAVTDPVVGSILGVTLFGEHLGATGPLAIGVTIAAIATMFIGTVSLARSPLVQHEADATPEPSPA